MCAYGAYEKKYNFAPRLHKHKPPDNTMIEKNDCIKVGIIAKPHGINGEVIARADSSFTVDDLSYEYLLVELDGGLVPYFVEEIRHKNDEESIVKFEFSDTQDDARRLSGAAVYIKRNWADAEADDLSVGMLVGFSATDAHHGALGTITDIDQQGGANPLFVIDNNGQELLIPVTDDFIQSIDTEGKNITFCLPEGLIDL